MVRQTQAAGEARGGEARGPGLGVESGVAERVAVGGGGWLLEWGEGCC